MEIFFIFLFIVVVLGAYFVPRFIERFRKRIVVHEYQMGLLYKNGKLQRQVGAGAYLINPQTTSIALYDTRRTHFIVAGQELSTKDNVTFKVSASVSYRMSDLQKAIIDVQSYSSEFYLLVQLALREELAKHSADELLENKTKLNEALQETLNPQAQDLGLELRDVQIRDFMFSNDLKRAFNEVLKARKEGEAQLERARGESAALRNLANSAKLLDANPNLLSLRLLQAIESSKGNSFTLDSRLLERKGAED